MIYKDDSVIYECYIRVIVIMIVTMIVIVLYMSVI